MTTSATSFSTARTVKAALKNSYRSGTKVIPAHARTAEKARGTDGLTSAERLAYAQKAQSLHHSLPAEELDKAFSRLPQ